MGRRIDETSPRVDARLPDGSRVNAIIEPLSLGRPGHHGPEVLDDAVHRRRPDPVRDGDAGDVRLPPGLHRGPAQRLRLGRHRLGQDDDASTSCRRSSPTTSGSSRSRTPPSSSSARSTSITLEARPPNLEGEGEITIRNLLRNAMHMRPDRIIVGECRAGEALDMLQAMTTGHDGSLSTGHANTPARHAPPARDDGPDDRLRDAAAGDPRADRLGRRPHRPHRPPQGRLAQDRQHHRGLRDRGRRDPDPGHLRRSSRPGFEDGKVDGELDADRHPADVHGPVRATGVELPPGEFGIPPRRTPSRSGAGRSRRAGAASRRPTRPDASAAQLGRGTRRRGRRDGLRVVDRPDRPRDRPGRGGVDQGADPPVPGEPQGDARGGRQLARQGRLGELVACATRRSSTPSTRSGCAGSRATRRSARGR